MGKTDAGAERRRGKNRGQSISNSLGTIDGNRFGAEQARFYLSALKKELGASQQVLIVKLVLAGFEVSELARPYRERIRKEWLDSRHESELRDDEI